MSDTTRVNISVSEEIHQFYKEQAKKTGVSMSAAMSTALFQQMMIMKQNRKKLES
ncbi:hypothetical protein D3C74_283610 [compost metagenome]